ncbi:MAG: zf-HC2 domain-containing protein [Pseudomonadota bacterium]
MKGKHILKIKNLLKGIKKLEHKLPGAANRTYFEQLETKIASRIKDEETPIVCKDIQQSLVDFLEGNMVFDKKIEVKKHLESCDECFQEYTITKNALEDALQVNVPEENLAMVSERINNEINFCETAQEHIANEFTGDPVPWKIRAHIETCPKCKKVAELTHSIVESVKRLSVPMPNEKFFEVQLSKIDRAIEVLPSARMERKAQISSYFNGIMDTLRGTLFQPYAAISVSAMLVLLIIGGRFYSSKDSIEEKQINLSEVISRANAVAEINEESGLKIDQTAKVSRQYLKENIQDPFEDEKLQIKSTGTAADKDRDRTKKIN